MRYSILFLVLLSATISQLSGQDKGIWVAYDSGKEYAADYLQAVGGNCLIYYPTVNADTVLAFDTYSHQWHEHPFHLSVLSSNAYAGENAAMVWNDSVLVLYDAIHSTFHDLKLDGEMIHSGSKPFNLPGNIGSLSYAITTEKIYIFDHETQEWFVYAYTNPGTGGPFTYSGNGKDDYVMISIANYPTSESKVIAFSKSRRVFEEISSVSLEWNILDHGFACWANVGIPEGDCFFTAYSAENGFMETIKPNRDFGTNINWNDPVAESTVFMATYYIPHESSPGGIRHIYAADTRHAAFNYYTFDDAYTGKVRPVATLSGGESFMAALSLALGLSDVVQAHAGGIHLDTLFIDEGFGSLDSESLDLAIRTLIDLQSSGRMIGVISHVAELKEQIPLRIDVSAGRLGSSVKLTG